MSQEHDDINNQNLKRLFEQNEPADDFEKEALEGFATLESQEEAFTLKANVDARLGETFRQEKKRGFAIWWAAAGILVTAGLAVLLFRNPVPENKNNVALNEPAPGTTTEERVVAADQEAGYKKKKQEDIKAESQEIKAVEQEVNGSYTPTEPRAKRPSKTVGSVTTAEKEEAHAGDATTSVPVVANASGAATYKWEAEKPTEPAKALAGEYKRAESEDTDKADVQVGAADLAQAETKNLESTKMVVSQSAPNAPQSIEQQTKRKQPAINNEKAAAEDDAKPDAMAKARADAERMAKEKAEAEAKAKSEAEYIAISSTQQERLAVEPKSIQNVPVQQTEIKQKAFKPNSGKQRKDESKPATKASNGAGLPAELSYNGGAEALNKDIKKLLDSKGLKGKFDAVLYFNTPDAVNRVEIAKAFNFSPEEQKTLGELLKALNKFEISQGTTSQQGYTYKISYRP